MSSGLALIDIPLFSGTQFPEKAIPKFTLLASRGSSLSVHGDGSSVRSYLYVEDVAEAFDRVLHKGVTGEWLSSWRGGTPPLARTGLPVCCI